jgi:PHP family Zn ribbon phosphoesterase
VLIHGTGIDHSYWDPVAPELGRHFTVYSVDRRGRGYSGDTAPYAIQREFEDVAAMVASIAGDVFLVGHSYGALPASSQKRGRDRNELIKRLLAEKCELCGSKMNVEVHHIRKLADLKEKGRKEKPRWVKKMAQRRRKTLIVCANCHENIHRGYGKPQTRKPSPESGVR